VANEDDEFLTFHQFAPPDPEEEESEEGEESDA
jgi:hypothetical protein